MTDVLLFLHLLSAAALFTAIVAFSAIVMGARVEDDSLTGFLVAYRGGFLGVLLFGIALAIDLDGVELWSAWVLIALALWAAAGWSGDRLVAAYREGGAGAIPADVARLHWVSVVVVLLLLADMIWKPFA